MEDAHPAQEDVALRLWTGRDLWLMARLLSDPVMTAHIGGPESPEQLRRRLDRYVEGDGPGTGEMYVIVLGLQRVPVGSVGFWPVQWQGEPAWETGWAVLPEFQGRGIGTRGTSLVVERAREAGGRGSIHAYPAIDNGPSNAVCRKVGFSLLGQVDVEYPAGNPMRCNDWALDLDGAPPGSESGIVPG